MSQYNPLKVQLSNSQLNKLKSGIKAGTTVKISSNVVVDFYDENICSHKFLLTNTKLVKAFANGSSANTKLRKSQFHKTIQSGENLR